MKKNSGSIARWFFGILFLLFAIGISKESVTCMIFSLIFGVSLLPVTWKILKNKGISYKRWLPIVIPIVSFIMMGSFMPTTGNGELQVEQSAKADVIDKSIEESKTLKSSSAETPALSETAAPETKQKEKQESETPVPTPTPEPTYNLSMHVLDVGQGLSVLIESGGEYLLYDGGDRDYSSKVVSYLKQQNVTALKYIVASHYDADHLNGIVGALNVFDVNTIIAPDYTADTKIYASFTDTLQKKDLSITYPVVGQQYKLGNSTFTILSPTDSDYADVNDYSVTIHLDCKDSSFIITGDATILSEAEMIASGQNLASDVMIVGHHGSAGSTSQEFLQSVSPATAIVSCKEDNQYQHPSQEVMERLQANGIPVYRTDKQGDIVISSNGSELVYSAEPCNDYSYGIAPTPDPQPETRISTDNNAGQISGDGSGDDSNFNTHDIEEQQQTEAQYVLNTSSMKFHYPSCSSVKKIAPHNYATSNSSRDELIGQGYDPCGNCEP